MNDANWMRSSSEMDWPSRAFAKIDAATRSEHGVAAAQGMKIVVTAAKRLQKGVQVADSDVGRF